MFNTGHMDPLTSFKTTILLTVTVMVTNKLLSCFILQSCLRTVTGEERDVSQINGHVHEAHVMTGPVAGVTPTCTVRVAAAPCSPAGGVVTARDVTRAKQATMTTDARAGRLTSGSR